MNTQLTARFLGFALARIVPFAALGLGTLGIKCASSQEKSGAPLPPDRPPPSPDRPRLNLPERLEIPATKAQGAKVYTLRPDAPARLPDPSHIFDKERLLRSLVGDPGDPTGGLLHYSSVSCDEGLTSLAITGLFSLLKVDGAEVTIEGDGLVERAKAEGKNCDENRPFTTDNLLIRVKGNDPNAPSVHFSAHMDCHPSHKPPSDFAVREGKIVSTSGDPLCADDLMGFAMALEGIRTMLDQPHLFRFSEAFVTGEVAEEIGIKGAKLLDPRHMAGDMVFILDGAEDPKKVTGGGGDIHFATIKIEGKGQVPSHVAAEIIASADVGVDGLIKGNPRQIMNIDQVRSEGRNPETVGDNFNAVAPYAEIRTSGASLNTLTQSLAAFSQDNPDITIKVTNDQIVIQGKTQHPAKAPQGANACVAGARLMLGLGIAGDKFFWCGTEGKGPANGGKFGASRTLTWQIRNLDVRETDNLVKGFEETALGICKKHGVTCTTGGMGRVVKGFSIDRNGALAQVVRGGFGAARMPEPEIPDAFGGSAANEFAARGGIEAVVWPTGDHDLHTPNEHVVLEELWQSMAALVGAELVLSQYQQVK